MWPVGAVSMTTKPSRRRRRRARRRGRRRSPPCTGERRSSSSRARPGVVERGARGAHHLGGVGAGLGGGIDAAHASARPPARPGRPARAPPDRSWSDGPRGPAARARRRRRTATLVLPTPPLPMVMMTPCPPRSSSAMSAASERERGRRRLRRRRALARCGGSASGAAPAGAKSARRAATPDEAERQQRQLGARQRARAPRASRRARARPRSSSARAIGIGARPCARNRPLSTSSCRRDAERRELAAGALRLDQGRPLRAAHQDERRPLGVHQRAPRGVVERLLRLQPRQRTEARGAADVRLEEPRPRRGQLQQAQRVPGRRRVEDDVIEAGGRAGVAEELGELVEGGDLDGAGARELLLDALHRRVGEHAAVRPDHALAVRVRGGLRIDVERGEAGAPATGRGSAPSGVSRTSSRFEAGSVLTSEHAPPARRERQRGGAGDRRSCPRRPCP